MLLNIHRLLWAFPHSNSYFNDNFFIDAKNVTFSLSLSSHRTISSVSFFIFHMMCGAYDTTEWMERKFVVENRIISLTLHFKRGQQFICRVLAVVRRWWWSCCWRCELWIDSENRIMWHTKSLLIQSAKLLTWGTNIVTLIITTYLLALRHAAVYESKLTHTWQVYTQRSRFTL